jgi:hypothetical protein
MKENGTNKFVNNNKNDLKFDIRTLSVYQRSGNYMVVLQFLNEFSGLKTIINNV